MHSAPTHLSPFADLAHAHAISAELDRFVDLLEWLATGPRLPLGETDGCPHCGSATCADIDDPSGCWAAPETICDPNECGRCDGDGEIGSGHGRQTCPVCRGSGLSSLGEARLRVENQVRERLFGGAS